MVGLEKKLDILVQIVLRARAFFDFWWTYEGLETRQKYLPGMNNYSEFFRFDVHAHQLSYIIYLCQIFESRTKTLSINNVLKEVQDRGISDRNIVEAQRVLQEGTPIYKKLVIVRSNLFAHRSASLNYPEAFSMASVNPNDIRRLTELALEATNLLRLALGLETQEFSTLPKNHIEKLLKEIQPFSWRDSD